MNSYDYKSVTVECKDQIATITFVSPAVQGVNVHWELGSLFSHLRDDNSVRVIILTGSGGHFKVPVPKAEFDEKLERYQDPGRSWYTFTGILRTHQAMAEIEKPIIAKVNGDAIGFGQSIMFASDFIVAREDAVIRDHHMGGTFVCNYNGEEKTSGHDASIVPGDGGGALVPLFMTPCKAKEYLMLSQPYTAAELARQGIINYAVPAQELDAKVNDIAQRLLAKGAYALARTKRLINRQVVNQLNLALDAGVAYQIATQIQPFDITKLG